MECPCENCLVFVMCKRKLFNIKSYITAVTDLAEYENCEKLTTYLVCGELPEINYCRALFGLNPLPEILFTELKEEVS